MLLPTVLASAIAAVAVPLVELALLLHLATYVWLRRHDIAAKLLSRPAPFTLGAAFPGGGGKKPLVLITGGACGIGFANAVRYVALGYDVELWDVQADKLADAAQQLLAARPPTSGLRVTTKVVDCGSHAAVTAAANAVLDGGGVPDVLVLNAGIVTGQRIGRGMDLEAVARLYRVNVLQLFAACNTFVPAMSGAGTAGSIAPGWARSIVVVGSVAGFAGAAHVSDYNSSKAAANLFAESLRADIAALPGATVPVQVTLVCPYRVDTGMFAGCGDVRLLSELTAGGVADQMVDAVRLRKDVLVTPYRLMLWHAVKGLLPWWVFPVVDRVIGASASVSTFVDQKRKAQ
jgi:NAD(P)-dependent dehydrogenase (short-subunit alcohol dehydrogenase family)